MPNRLTRGKSLVGESVPASGLYVHVLSGTIARSNTTAKTLFTIPASATIVGVRLSGATASDAGTTATVNVGWTSAAFSDILNAVDVKGGGTGVLSTGSVTTLGSVGTSDRVVKGKYAETGTASTTGGSWTVFVEYTLA